MRMSCLLIFPCVERRQEESFDDKVTDPFSAESFDLIGINVCLVIPQFDPCTDCLS